jgi:phosphopantetheinyl transferase
MDWIYTDSLLRECQDDVDWHDWTPDWGAVLQVFATPAERVSVETVMSRNGACAFLWCCKEAVLKARCTGLSEPLWSAPVPKTMDAVAVHMPDGATW